MYLASAVSSILSLRISRVDFIRGAFFGGHSEYVVEIDEMSGHRSTVSKRYRDFLEFHRQLSLHLQETNLRSLGTQADILAGESSSALPSLPPKKLVGNLEPGFVERRRLSLEAYLKELLEHPKVVATSIFWRFLDVEDATVTIAQFLGELNSIPSALERLDRVATLLNNAENSFRISHPLVLQRILHLTAEVSSDAAFGRLCCSILARIALHYPDSQVALVQNAALRIVLELLNTDALEFQLALPVLQFCLIIVLTYPAALLAYFRVQQGLSQLLRLLGHPSLVPYHALLGLLLWFGIDVPEVQLVLAEPDSRGMELIVALYESQNANARLLSGLIIAFLLVKQRFTTSELVTIVAEGIGALPTELLQDSCRSRRLLLFSTHQWFPFESADLPQQLNTFPLNDAQTLPQQTFTPAARPTHKSQGSLSNGEPPSQTFLLKEPAPPDPAVTVISSLSFETFASVVAQGTQATFLPGPRKPNVSNSQLPSDAACSASTTALHFFERQGPLRVEAVDYVVVYAACCANRRLLERFGQLFVSCCNMEVSLLEGSSATRDQILIFLLWVLMILMCATHHVHHLSNPYILEDTIWPSVNELRQALQVSEGQLSQRTSPLIEPNSEPTDHPNVGHTTVGVDHADGTHERVQNVNSFGSQNSGASTEGGAYSVSMSQCHAAQSPHILPAAQTSPIAKGLKPCLNEEHEENSLSGVGKWSVTGLKSAQESLLRKQQSVRSLFSDKLGSALRKWHDKTLTAGLPLATNDNTTQGTSGNDNLYAEGVETVWARLQSHVTHLRPHVECELSKQNAPLFTLLSPVQTSPWVLFSEVPQFLPALNHCLFNSSSSKTISTYAAVVLLSAPWIQYNEVHLQPLGVSSVRAKASMSTKQHNQDKSIFPRFLLNPAYEFSNDVPDGDEGMLSELPRPLVTENKIAEVVVVVVPFAARSSTTGTVRCSKDDGLQSQAMSMIKCKSQVPGMRFVVTQQLLRQRLTALQRLLEFGETTGQAEYDNLRREQTALEEQELRVLERQQPLPFDESGLLDFFDHFRQYVRRSVCLLRTALYGKQFIAQMLSREKALRVTRKTLHHRAMLLEEHAARAASETAALCKIRDAALAQEHKLMNLREKTDALFRQLIDSSSALRRLRDMLQAARKEAQRRRDRWMETERMVAEAPQRRKILAQQLSEKERLVSQAASKVRALHQAIAVADVELGQVNAEKKHTVAVRNAVTAARNAVKRWEQQGSLKRTRLPSTPAHTSAEAKGAGNNDGSDDACHSHTSSTESSADAATESFVHLLSQLPPLLTQTNALSELSQVASTTHPEEGVQRLLSILNALEEDPTAAFPSDKNSALIAASPATLDQLKEQQRGAEAELLRRTQEVRSVRKSLESESNIELLVERSTHLQADVRLCDTEVVKIEQKKEQDEERMRATERELEACKMDLRLMEANFAVMLETLHRKLEEENEARQNLCYETYQLETQVSRFLSELASTQEDRQCATMNLLVLHFMLNQESRDRAMLRERIRQFGTLLQEADALLGSHNTELSNSSLLH